MAVGSPAPPQHHASPAPTTPSANHIGIDIDAWTISALQSLSVSPVARGTGTPLSIPIDEHVLPVVRAATPSKAGTAAAAAAAVRGVVRFQASGDPVTPPQRPRSRRDSMATRDALLRGKEGSRQRRRWENDRLIGVPNAQPPQPADWHIQPTHPIHHVPYQIAQFWDRGVRERVQEKTKRLQVARKKQQLLSGSATGLGVGEVPRDLRESAKRSPIVRGWVRALEEPVRQFIHDQQQQQQQQQQKADASGVKAMPDDDDLDSDEEEIVFAGRSDAMRELREKKARWRAAHREVSRETVDSGVVFDSFGDDESASYKRWLTHSISDYYGLASRSVMVGNSSQKVVYVGLKRAQHLAPAFAKMPRPLWEIC